MLHKFSEESLNNQLDAFQKKLIRNRKNMKGCKFIHIYERIKKIMNIRDAKQLSEFFKSPLGVECLALSSDKKYNDVIG